MSVMRKVIDWMDHRRAVSFDVTEDLVGGASIDKHGIPVTDKGGGYRHEFRRRAARRRRRSEVDDLPFAQKPERGLLRLRKDLASMPTCAQHSVSRRWSMPPP